MVRGKITIKRDKLDRAVKDAKSALDRAVDKCLEDLLRVSSAAAPHDTGVLEKSHTKEVIRLGDKVSGHVTYTVRKGGGFNYALAMHEKSYKLGEGSLRKPGARGMSGKTYSVGNKFLERPLQGESKTYKEHIEKEIGKPYKT